MEVSIYTLYASLKWEGMNSYISFIVWQAIFVNILS